MLYACMVMMNFHYFDERRQKFELPRGKLIKLTVVRLAAAAAFLHSSKRKNARHTHQTVNIHFFNFLTVRQLKYSTRAEHCAECRKKI